MNGGDEDSQDFCCLPTVAFPSDLLSASPSCMFLVKIIPTKIYVNRMARCLKGNTL